ncbi:MAG: helix-turn-helix domain-containing protein [Microbacteriaceae bacterium]|nr:helix-turn-helix domain-containing protein [Microbacteriaceae bacterium]
MARRTDDFRGLTQPSRMRLLAEVQAEPGLLLRELAIRTGLHENTVRDHLLVLEAEGLITRQTVRAGRRGRPPETYHPVRDAHLNPEAARRVDQAVQHGDLLRRMRADTTGANLGRDAQHQIDALYEHLDDSGFEPELAESALEIDLVPCPYNTMVEGDPDLVCRVHSQLISDTLNQVPGPVRLELLQPHLEHDLCRVHLTLAASRSIPATTSAPAPTSTSSHSPSA